MIPFSAAMYIPARGFCAPTVFTGIAIALLLEKIDMAYRRLFNKVLTIVFLLLFITGAADILTVHHADLKRQAAIQEALTGDGILVASPYPVKTKYSAQYGLLDLMPDEDWPKDMIKEFYGLKDIIVLSEG